MGKIYTVKTKDKTLYTQVKLMSLHMKVVFKVEGSQHPSTTHQHRLTDHQTQLLQGYASRHLLPLPCAVHSVKGIRSA